MCAALCCTRAQLGDTGVSGLAPLGRCLQRLSLSGCCALSDGALAALLPHMVRLEALALRGVINVGNRC